MISVFTPSHNPRFLNECYESLRKQTYSDWEWVVVLNRGARWAGPQPPSPEQPVTVVEVPEALSPEPLGVGALKRLACEIAQGDILLELDHDDLLRSDALFFVAETFARHQEASLVYSDWAHINGDGSRNDSRWNPVYGWSYREAAFDGQSVLQIDSMPPLPHNVSYIWFTPNHLRAFRSDAYREAGGYDPSLDILDDQDLMCRLYQVGEFRHIPECLYLQRLHDNNTHRDGSLNPRIQHETIALYDHYVQDNALAWARREGLLALDMGAAHNKADGYLGVDQYPGAGVDIVTDVSKGLDLADNSVGVVRAVDFLEHIADKVALFNEFYRVLAHGGMVLSLTPSTDGRGAFQDPTHVAFYNENSFWYFTDAAHRAYVPEITCRFQVSRLVTYFPDDWHRHHDIPYVCANLVAIKDGPRVGAIGQ